jgi:serine/threonine protein kinase
MQEVGKYVLPGINIYKGKFANTEQCVLKSNHSTMFSFKIILGDSQKPELMLFRYLNFLKKNELVYKVRNFPDEYGLRNQKIMIDFLLPGQGGVVFILPMANESLKKTLTKRYQYFHSEFAAITILTQIMMSYKVFYELQIPYKIINPANVLKYNNDYVLVPPSTLMFQPEVMNPDSTLNDFDYLYTAPEILKKYSIDKFGLTDEAKEKGNEDFYSQNEKILTSPGYNAQFESILHKQDVWSMGVILYRLLFGIFPFQHQDSKRVKDTEESFIKPTWSNKKKYEECTFRWYWYYKHIMTNDLIFPKQMMIHKDIINLLQRMLEKDPIKRISYPEMKKHPFMNYYMIMHRTKTEGVTYRINAIHFEESKIIKEKDARKIFKQVLKKKVKDELERNKQRRKTLYEKRKQRELDRKRAKTQAEIKLPKIKEEGRTPNKKPVQSTLFGDKPVNPQPNPNNDYDIFAKPRNDPTPQSNKNCNYRFFIISRFKNSNSGIWFRS